MFSELFCQSTQPIRSWHFPLKRYIIGLVFFLHVPQLPLWKFNRPRLKNAAHCLKQHFTTNKLQTTHLSHENVSNFINLSTLFNVCNRKELCAKTLMLPLSQNRIMDIVKNPYSLQKWYIALRIRERARPLPILCLKTTLLSSINFM